MDRDRRLVLRLVTNGWKRVLFCSLSDESTVNFHLFRRDSNFFNLLVESYSTVLILSLICRVLFLNKYIKLITYDINSKNRRSEETRKKSSTCRDLRQKQMGQESGERARSRRKGKEGEEM